MLIVTRGTGGDLVPFLGIGNALKRRGHDVTLFSHCAYANAARRAGLGFIAFDNPEEFDQFIKDGPLLNTPQGIPAFFRRHVLPKILAECEIIKEQYHKRDLVLITRHMSSIAALVAAEKLDIPIIRVFLAVTNITTIPFLVKLYKNILSDDINQIREKVGLSPVVNWEAWVKKPSTNIATWPEWFAASDATWPVEAVPVGFINHDETETGAIPDKAQTVLDCGELPILVTGGTGVYMPPKFYAASAEACGLLERPAILVTRHQQLVPRDLPSNVQHFDYLPFASLMPHVGVVIHHAGASTFSRALAAGIPQLPLPFGGDRPDNAARLQQLGVAEFLLPPQWQPDLIAKTLHRLLTSFAVQECCLNLAHRLQNTNAAVVACEVIEEFLSNGSFVEKSETLPQAGYSNASALMKKQDSRKSKLLKKVSHLSPERRQALLKLRLKKEERIKDS
jgi:UDP:flavonoid glycosyltransferase YjiC (YdhE family)